MEQTSDRGMPLHMEEEDLCQSHDGKAVTVIGGTIDTTSALTTKKIRFTVSQEAPQISLRLIE